MYHLSTVLIYQKFWINPSVSATPYICECNFNPVDYFTLLIIVLFLTSFGKSGFLNFQNFINPRGDHCQFLQCTQFEADHMHIFEKSLCS